MIEKKSTSAEAGFATFLHMENINYPLVNQHGNENPSFPIRNISSNGGFSVASCYANLPAFNLFLKIIIILSTSILVM